MPLIHNFIYKHYTLFTIYYRVEITLTGFNDLIKECFFVSIFCIIFADLFYMLMSYDHTVIVLDISVAVTIDVYVFSYLLYTVKCQVESQCIILITQTLTYRNDNRTCLGINIRRNNGDLSVTSKKSLIPVPRGRIVSLRRHPAYAVHVFAAYNTVYPGISRIKIRSRIFRLPRNIFYYLIICSTLFDHMINTVSYNIYSTLCFLQIVFKISGNGRCLIISKLRYIRIRQFIDHSGSKNYHQSHKHECYSKYNNQIFPVSFHALYLTTGKK